MKARTSLKSYAFIFPSFLLIGVFFYYPVFYAISGSFTDLRLGEKASFIGFGNYLKLLEDPVFLKGLANQLFLTIADVLKSILFPLLAAELLYFIKHKGTAAKIRTFFVIPMLVPGMVVMLMWVYMYDVNFGAVNTLLEQLGLGAWKHDWLKESETALWSIVGIGFPFVSGIYFLIFHAGLASISGEVEEAALIDGCSSWNRVRYIHLPHIFPYFGVVFILTMIASLQDYVKILVTTRGGPGYDTYVPALHMYNTAFKSYEMGYASSMGVILFIIIIAFTVVSMKLSHNRQA
ncbi:carbohydrate ABC transporter permease [Paenibacillus sp. MBLB4367]|uniref:carbohydrate ABC transporter permease n=1 Tax=Paenibacillus sp. MBLB4367 TaxID=3384767 RepID=UPI0039081C7F